MQIRWVNCCSPSSGTRFYSFTRTSVGYFVGVGNWLKFWPLNGVWPTAAPKQTNLSKMTATGSATYTAFQEAHGLKALLQYTLIPSFTRLHWPTYILFFFLTFLLKTQFDSDDQMSLMYCWITGFKAYLHEHKGAQRSSGRCGNPNNIPREKELPPWLLPERDQPVGQVWHPSPQVNGWGFMGHCTEKGYCLQGYGTLGDGGEEHLWDCTRWLMGCLEEESKVGKRGDKGGLVWKNKRIWG